MAATSNAVDSGLTIHPKRVMPAKAGTQEMPKSAERRLVEIVPGGVHLLNRAKLPRAVPAMLVERVAWHRSGRNGDTFLPVVHLLGARLPGCERTRRPPM